MKMQMVGAALIFFHRQNTFLYFHKLLPNLVFLKPQVPLTFVNAIVCFSYKVSAGSLQGFPAKFVPLLRDAIITEEMLEHNELSSCFIPGLYEAQHAITLFCHTFTIAPLCWDQQQPSTSTKKAPQSVSGAPDDEKYLMMCLLPTIPDEKLSQHIPPSSNLVPLLVTFTDDCVPLGCFSSTICCLLSTFKWEISVEVDEKRQNTPECLKHNIVSLFHPNLPVKKIVLIDSVRHITVYIDTDEIDYELLPEICSQVRETVTGAVKKVLDIMTLTEIEVSPAVLCPCETSSEAHSAHHFKMKSKNFIRCSIKSTCFKKAQDRHMMWLGIEQGHLTNESIPELSQSSKH